MVYYSVVLLSADKFLKKYHNCCELGLALSKSLLKKVSNIIVFVCFEVGLIVLDISDSCEFNMHFYKVTVSSLVLSTFCPLTGK